MTRQNTNKTVTQRNTKPGDMVLWTQDGHQLAGVVKQVGDSSASVEVTWYARASDKRKLGKRFTVGYSDEFLHLGITR